MKKAILVATIGALTLSVNAGEWGKNPKAPKVPIEECVDLGAEISVSYLTDYFFNGYKFGEDAVATEVKYTYDGLAVPLTFGVFYLNATNDSFPFGGAYDELNLYVSAKLGTFAGFDVDLSYTHYMFPEMRGSVGILDGYGEVGLNARRSLGFADLLLESNVAFGNGFGSPDGWYHQAALEKAYSLTDNIGLVLTAGVAYSDGYHAPSVFSGNRGSGWNHYFLTAAFPIQLNCRATLTPYVGYVGTPDTWVVDGAFNGGPFIPFNPQFQNGQVHGGVTLSVSF